MDSIDKLIAEVPRQGRPKSNIKRTFKRLQLRSDLCDRVDTALAKPGFESQPNKGIKPSAWRDLVEQLLEQWLKENT